MANKQKVIKALRKFEDVSVPTDVILINLLRLGEHIHTSFTNFLKDEELEEDEEVSAKNSVVDMLTVVNEAAARMVTQTKTIIFLASGLVVTNFVWIIRELFIQFGG